MRGAENSLEFQVFFCLSIHLILSESLAMWVYLTELLDMKVEEICNQK